MCAHQQAIAYKRWARYIIVGKNAQCKADEQFCFDNKNWVRSINKKKTIQVKTKKETNYNNKTQKCEQLLENSQNKIVEKTKQC